MDFIKRMYAVLQIRTGFVAVATSMIGLAYSIGQGMDIRWIVMSLFISAAFAVNIVTNIANGIAGVKKEDNLTTINDHYRGKNGLVTGHTKLSDAYLALAIFTIYTIGAGLLVVLLTRAVWFLLVGILSVFVAIIYSMGPKPLTNYPVTELISGLFCGFIPTVSVIVFNGGIIDMPTIMCGIISWIMVGLLMLTNNACDVEKDRNHRVTLGHVFSERGIFKLYITCNIAVSICGIFLFELIGSLNLAMFFAVVNVLVFKYQFFNKFTRIGTKVVGNKGIFIPRYLAYYYQTICILCILLIISNY